MKNIFKSTHPAITNFASIVVIASAIITLTSVFYKAFFVAPLDTRLAAKNALISKLEKELEDERKKVKSLDTKSKLLNNIEILKQERQEVEKEHSKLLEAIVKQVRRAATLEYHCEIKDLNTEYGATICSEAKSCKEVLKIYQEEKSRFGKKIEQINQEIMNLQNKI